MPELKEIRERMEAIFRAAAEEHDAELLHEHLEASRQLHDESLSLIEVQNKEIEGLKQKIEDQDDYIVTLEEDLQNAREKD